MAYVTELGEYMQNYIKELGLALFLPITLTTKKNRLKLKLRRFFLAILSAR